MPPGAGLLVGGALTIGAKLLDPQDDNEVSGDISEVRQEIQTEFKELEREIGKVESGINDLKSEIFLDDVDISSNCYSQISPNIDLLDYEEIIGK